MRNLPRVIDVACLRASARLLVMPLLFALWPAAGELFDFESTETGAMPAGWLEVNSDRGVGSTWAVFAHLEATSGTKVLAKAAMLPNSRLLPKAIWLGRSFLDGDIKVRIKPMGGLGSQIAGLVFRYRDEGSFCLVSANLITGEVSVQRIEAGRMFPIATASAGAFQPDQVGWTLCQVVFEGPRIVVYINGRKCIEAEDSSEGWPGRVGLWAAPGSFTNFDDFEILPNRRLASSAYDSGETTS
jgi:hypothetical protein